MSSHEDEYLKDLKRKFKIERLELEYSEPAKTLEQFWEMEQDRKKNQKRFFSFGSCEKQNLNIVVRI